MARLTPNLSIEVWGFLFDVGVLERLETFENYHLTSLVKQAIFKSLNVRKLVAAIGIYSGMLNITKTRDGRTEIVQELTSKLLHQYPIVRNTAADSLYLRYPDCELLKSVDWMHRDEGRRQDVRSIRLHIQESENEPFVA